MHREDQGQAGERRDWRKILGEVEMQIGAGGRVRQVRGGADVERVPVRRRASHKFRGKAAAGPWPAFDHHLLMQALAHGVTEKTGGDVSSRAGREADDQAQRARWEILRAPLQCCGEAQCQRQCQ